MPLTLTLSPKGRGDLYYPPLPGDCVIIESVVIPNGGEESYIIDFIIV
jgi:hypothetical protein